ncbi:MAG: glycosyltransferase [Armatimonadetes bacterium]|nr:glycosyltransferase [Armatimonadota bacterium]
MSQGSSQVLRRVLILHATYAVGGAERVLQLLAQQLRSRFDLQVCALYQPGVIGEQIQASGLPFVALQGRSRTDWRVLPRFLRLLRQLRPDVLLTVDSPYAVLYAVIAKRLSLVRRLVIAAHSFGKVKRTREMKFARRLASSVTDTLIALAETHRRFLVEREGWRVREIVVIPNGVDLQRFTPQGHHYRVEWGLSPHHPSFGIVAGLRPEKNLFRFLRVAQRVLNALPEAHAFVVGDGELRHELQTFSHQMRCDTRITFTGALQDIPAVWRSLHVAVLTSDTEVLPMTLIEAAACGVPAVSTDVGAVREIVLDGETGFVVPPEDEQALAERILYLLLHPDERQRMGVRARQHAESHFDLRQMIERYARVLEA